MISRDPHSTNVDLTYPVFRSPLSIRASRASLFRPRKPQKCTAPSLVWLGSCSARTVSLTTSVCSSSTTVSVSGGSPRALVTSCTPTSSPSTAWVLLPCTPLVAWSSATRPGSKLPFEAFSVA